MGEGAQLCWRVADKAARWRREAYLLTSVPGFGKVAAQARPGEIGPAPHLHFASHEKLTCWVSLCLVNNISARKRSTAGPQMTGPTSSQMLVQAAWAAIRVRGRLQTRYSRPVRRFGGEQPLREEEGSHRDRAHPA